MPRILDFNFMEDIGPRDENHIKCSHCGHEADYNPNVPYSPQGTCPYCNGQMLGWDWAGWKDTEARSQRWKEQERKRKQAKKIPVSQESESFENFTVEERTIHDL